MNTAFRQNLNLGAFGPSTSQPYLPSSPIMNPENEDSYSAMDHYWLVSGNISSPVKLSPTAGAGAEAGIPVDFDSRAVKNMLYAEKINYWLQNVPWFQTERNVWVLDCYPGIVSFSDQSEDDLVSTCEEDQDKVEYQCRQVTKLVTSLYYCESQEVARPHTTTGDAAESEVIYSDDEYFFGEVTAVYV